MAAKKKKKSGPHESYKDTNKLHEPARGYENGACLIKHVYPFKDRDSCSYRWQGVHKASTQPGKGAYNAHRTASYHIGGRGTAAFKPENVAAVEASAGMKGVLKVAKTMTKKGLRSIVEVKNFTTGSVPYNNQVHHILTEGSLHGGIDDLADIWTEIRKTIVDGLLTEKYNLNHHANNIILPMREYDCRQTGLPKHKGDHPGYSARIRQAVKAALQPYEAIANEMKDTQTHDQPEPLDLKDELVSISDTMYANFIALAATNRATNQDAMSVNNLPASAFAGLPSV